MIHSGFVQLTALDEQERKWPCYECNKRFKTSAALQKHLVVHEENTSNHHQDDDFSIRGETMMQKNRRKGFSLQTGTLKRKRRHSKVVNIINILLPLYYSLSYIIIVILFLKFFLIFLNWFINFHLSLILLCNPNL